MERADNTNLAERPAVDFEAWGKAVAEEVLFRAGLDMSDAGASANAAHAALQFDISAVAADRSLALSFERIGGAAVKIQIFL